MERNSSVVVEPHELELRLSSTPSSSSDHRRQKMTIFYDGRMISSSDLTGVQARAIIEMAKKEGNKVDDFSFPATTEAPAPAAQPIIPGLSMKRSLQRFLQKRKARIVDHSCPYGDRRQPLMQLFT
ncbi:Protein TIFY 5A [Platanthera zijinensis]|uniref:Protein TIFY n=1 Tax=Platanthera zijinensis TaxID=2320716 RepID=A0AAP0GGG7_9ASPA